MTSVISILTEKNLIPQLHRHLPKIQFHNVENPEIDKQFRMSEIIIADFNLISPYIYNLPNVKWVQGTSAGIDRLMKGIRPLEPPKYPITRFTGKHFGFLMSEYVVSNIINNERNYIKMVENQKLKQWGTNGKISEYRAVFELTIGILGVGSIGNKIGKTLNSMGANIFGYGRRPSFDLKENYHISRYFTKNTLPEMLQSCDYIVNTLPSTEETKGLLNGNILENCKNIGSVFINIGRGTIISEQSLVTSLENNWISGAILDVFDPEPLCSSSPLWEMPNVTIIPHVSGKSRAQDIAEHFKENFSLFQQKLTMPATIDFSIGY